MTSKNTDADLKAQVNQLRKTVTKNTALLNTLNNNVEALIHVLTPLFPRLSNSYNTNEAIERALDNEARGKNSTFIAHESQPDFLGERDLGNLVGDCEERYKKDRTAKAPYPPTKLRLECLARVLLQENSEEDVDEDLVAQHYRIWKAVARGTADTILKERPELDGLTWPCLLEAYPQLCCKAVLHLEASLRRYSLHRCINSWASDKLLYEAFRNKSSQAKSKAKEATDKEGQSREGSTATENNAIENHVMEEFVIEDISNEDLASVGLCDSCEDEFEDVYHEDEQQDEDNYLSNHEEYEEDDHVYSNNSIENIQDAYPSIETSAKTKNYISKEDSGRQEANLSDNAGKRRNVAKRKALPDGSEIVSNSTSKRNEININKTTTRSNTTSARKKSANINKRKAAATKNRRQK